MFVLGVKHASRVLQYVKSGARFTKIGEKYAIPFFVAIILNADGGKYLGLLFHERHRHVRFTFVRQYGFTKMMEGEHLTWPSKQIWRRRSTP